MRKKKGIPFIEIGRRLKLKKSFTVPAKSDRTNVLNAAKFLGIPVTTREKENGEFEVLFLSKD